MKISNLLSERPIRTFSLPFLLGAAVVLLAGCPPKTPPLIHNATAITVGSNMFPGLGAGGVNHPYVSVSVCVPNSNAGSCATVDNILLDTGSVGLRIFSSALPISLVPISTGTNSGLFQCAAFGSGSVWGPVTQAVVTLGSEPAVTVPIQVLAPGQGPAPPTNSGCNLGTLTKPTDAGLNGVLGLAPFQHDNDSVILANSDVYFSCGMTSACGSALTTVASAQQVANPVFALPGDNNGIIIKLPSVPNSGAVNEGGDLIFGLNTVTPFNDPMALSGSATIHIINKSAFQTPTMFNGVLSNAFVDTGSDAMFFPSTMPSCGGLLGSFYCPNSSTMLAAQIDPAAANLPVAFQVDNATTLTATGLTAFPNIGGNFGSGFLWGIPFFYGRIIYIVYGPVTGSVTWNPPMWAFSSM
ncbi:MAG TPA: DUF3443 family protein [Candidatus Acidoferrales bacterium]|nr:DUF3443 family protein [Candidatus Acidoferrales bacterium]